MPFRIDVVFENVMVVIRDEVPSLPLILSYIYIGRVYSVASYRTVYFVARSNRRTYDSGPGACMAGALLPPGPTRINPSDAHVISSR